MDFALGRVGDKVVSDMLDVWSAGIFTSAGVSRVCSSHSSWGFSSAMVGALRAGSNQAAEPAAETEALALSVAIGRRLGAEVRRI